MTNNNLRNIISGNTKYLRFQMSLTQEQFAKRCSIKRPNVGAIEEGRTSGSLEVLVKIARATGVSLDELITEDLTKKKV